MSARTPVRAVLRGLSSVQSPATPFTRPASSSIRGPSVRCLHADTRTAPLTASRAARRPTTTRSQARSCTPTGSATSGRRTIFIQTEPTPNADALKFKPNTRVLPEGFPAPFLEYLSPRSTLAPPHPSPLAAKLLNVDGVTSVFFGQDYITVTKDSATNWAHVKPEVFSLVTEVVTSGAPMVNTASAAAGAGAAGAEETGQSDASTDSLAYDESDSEVVGMIKELLETRIRPAIQEDGGDIEFRGFEDGQVLLKLRGACRTCDSSTVTLKNGIEGMLMHYIEEVRGVQQVLDQEEEVAMREFAAFEEKLKQQTGRIPAGTGGKGTLDTAA